MADGIVSQEWQYEPLTTQRMCRNEIAHLRMELERIEKLSRFDAEVEAVQLLAELRDYADEWDTWVFKQGNPSGMPF